jgi:hypothetical protein
MGILLVEYGEIRRCGNDVSVGMSGVDDCGYDEDLGNLRGFGDELVIF